MLGAVVFIFALIAITLKTNLLSRPVTIGLVIAFMVVCRWLSRRSANAMRLRQKEELERLKRTPVLGLND
jgi:Flp pilus assembly protein TadB